MLLLGPNLERKITAIMEGNNSGSPGMLPYSEFVKNRPCVHLPSPIPFEGEMSVHGDKYSGRLCNTPTAHCYMPRPLQGPNPYVLFNNGETMQVGKDCNWAIPSPVENKSRSASPWCYDTTTMVQGGVQPFYSLGYPTIPQSWTHSFLKSSVGFSSEHGVPTTDLADPVMVMEQDYYGTVRPVTPHTGIGTQPQDSKVSSTSEVSPFKGLPPVTDLLSVLRCSPSLWHSERTSPSDSVGQETLGHSTPLQHNISANLTKSSHQQSESKWAEQATGAQNKPEYTVKFNETLDDLIALNTSQLSATKISAERQRRQQREREHAIKRSLDNLCELLPWGEEERKPTKNNILLRAINYIQELTANLEKERTRQNVQDKRHSETEVVANQEKDYRCDRVSQVTSEVLEIDTSDRTNNNRRALGVSQTKVCKELGPKFEQEANFGEDESCNPDSCLGPQPVPAPSSPHIKRPMNAFMIFSQEHRKMFKELFPTQDNRKISASLADHWHRLSEGEKQPYREKAKDLMQRTREDHPGYKYYDSSKKRPQCFGAGCSPSKSVKKKPQRLGDDSKVRQQGDPGPKSKQQGSVSPALTGDDDSQHQTRADEEQYERSEAFQTRPVSVLPLYSRDFNTFLRRTELLQNEDTSHNKSVDNWIQCNSCESWRLLPDCISLSSLPEKWYCCKKCNDRSTPQRMFDVVTNAAHQRCEGMTSHLPERAVKDVKSNSDKTSDRKQVNVQKQIDEAVGLEGNASEVTKKCAAGTSELGLGKCRRIYGMDQKHQWCRNCQHKKKCEIGKK